LTFTEACDCCADDTLGEDENRHEREPVTRHRILLLLLLLLMMMMMMMRLGVSVATLCSVHITTQTSGFT